MTQEDYVNAAYKWMARKTTQDFRLILMKGGKKMNDLIPVLYTVGQ